MKNPPEKVKPFAYSPIAKNNIKTNSPEINNKIIVLNENPRILQQNNAEIIGSGQIYFTENNEFKENSSQINYQRFISPKQNKKQQDSATKRQLKLINAMLDDEDELFPNLNNEYRINKPQYQANDLNNDFLLETLPSP